MDDVDESEDSFPVAQEVLRNLAESVSAHTPRSALKGAVGSLIPRPAIESVISAARAQSSVIEQVKKSIATAALSQFRLADFVVPPAFKMAELSATARLVDFALPSGALASWRQSLLLQNTAAEIAKRWQIQLPLEAAWTAEIHRMSSLLPSLSESALASVTGNWISAVATDPTRQLRAFLFSLPDPPGAHNLAIGARASHGVAGFAGFDVAVLDDAPSEAIDRIETELLVPWREGPQAARDELLRRLQEIDPELPELLLGAWTEIDLTSPRPAAVVKMTTCATELIERSLRTLAPDEAVTDWYSAPGRPKMEADSRGGPTYGARARYVLEGKPERRLVVSQIDAVVAQVPSLRGLFQSGKHASAGTITSFRTHLLSAEALLMQLLGMG